MAFGGRVHERTPGMGAADFITWVILRVHGRGRHEGIPGASRFLDESPPLWLALNERYVHFAAGAQMLPARVQKVRQQDAVHGGVFDPEVWVVEHNRGERSQPGVRQRDRVDAVHDPGAVTYELALGWAGLGVFFEQRGLVVVRRGDNADEGGRCG
jgi:hypothetical protein